MSNKTENDAQRRRSRKVKGGLPPLNYAPAPSTGPQPFLSTYTRERVALKCHGCGVIYYPKIWGNAECPYCFAECGGVVLVSIYEPAQAPRHQTLRKDLRDPATPPRAWEAYVAPSDLFKKHEVNNIRMEAGE
jgi:hypothetical protein